jgi:hypothetical protein
MLTVLKQSYHKFFSYRHKEKKNLLSLRYIFTFTEPVCNFWTALETKIDPYKNTIEIYDQFYVFSFIFRTKNFCLEDHSIFRSCIYLI